MDTALSVLDTVMVLIFLASLIVGLLGAVFEELFDMLVGGLVDVEWGVVAAVMFVVSCIYGLVRLVVSMQGG